MELKDLLMGNWHFRRIASTGETFVGTASFTPMTPSALHYREEGTVTFRAGGKGDFFRSYIYRMRPDALDIHFDDNAQGLFQHVALRLRDDAWTGSGHHKCPPDTYNTSYRFQNVPQRLTILHRVNGPRKDYRLETEYRRTP